jgi:hypothetical protein
MATEQSGAVELDSRGGGIKMSGAAMVAELADGDKGSRCKLGKDMGEAGSGG